VLADPGARGCCRFRLKKGRLRHNRPRSKAAMAEIDMGDTQSIIVFGSGAQADCRNQPSDVQDVRNKEWLAAAG